MATADNNKEIINSLITASNETTGKNDADLTTAVKSLISGFGGGTGGSGTLGVKSGTKDVTGGYTFSVEHGCGKLPKWVLVEVAKDTTPVLNSISFAFWQDNYVSFACRASTTCLINLAVMQKFENIDTSSGANAVMVDEEKIVISATATFVPGTFTWYAIYEVD